MNCIYLRQGLLKRRSVTFLSNRFRAVGTFACGANLLSSKCLADGS